VTIEAEVPPALQERRQLRWRRIGQQRSHPFHRSAASWRLHRRMSAHDAIVGRA
jgi:hypothetical protein